MDGDLIQGTLQRLLNEREGLQNTQKAAQAQQLESMRMPLPELSPIQSMVSDYLARYAQNPGMAFQAAAGASAGAPERERKAMESQLLRIQAADAEEAKMAGEALKEADVFGKTLTGMVRPALSKANAPQVKMDKDGNMVVYDPASGEAKIVHSSQRGEYQRLWSKAYQAAVDQGMENPEDYAHGVASNIIGTTQKMGGTAATAAQALGGTQTGAQAGTQAAQPNMMVGQPGVVPAAPALKYKDKPEQERLKELATGDEKAAREYYDKEVAPQAQAAESMLNTLSTIKQIPRTQDMFAPYREKVGSVMNAMGLDGSMVREAESLQQLRPMLAELANKRLQAAKGTQTEGDAQRAYNEFIKIEDTQAAVDFMYAWTQELATRAKVKDLMFTETRDKLNTWTKGKSYWNQSDYMKAAPVAFTKQGPKSYTEFRDQFLKMNRAAIDSGEVTVNDMLNAWNKLARGSK